jgi:hypothetical protein
LRQRDLLLAAFRPGHARADLGEVDGDDLVVVALVLTLEESAEILKYDWSRCTYVGKCLPTI